MPEARMNMLLKVTDEQAGALAGNLADAQQISDNFVFNTTSLGVTTLLVHADTYTFSGTTVTVDLTAILDIFGVTQDLDTAVIYACAVKPLGANLVNCAEAAANGYGLFPLSPGIDVFPGGVLMQRSVAGFGTIAGGSAQDLTFTGTNGQSFQMALVAGIA